MPQVRYIGSLHGYQLLKLFLLQSSIDWSQKLKKISVYTVNTTINKTEVEGNIIGYLLSN